MPFQYTPFQNPYVGSMASLISRGGEREAQAALRLAEIEAGAGQQRANAWGGAIEGVASAATAGLQQWQEAKEREREQAYVDLQRSREAEGFEREDALNASKALATQRFGEAQRGTMDTPIGQMPLGGHTFEDVAPSDPGDLPSRTLVPGKNPYLRTDRGIELWNTETFMQQAAVDGTPIDVMIPYIQFMESANNTKNANLDSTITSAKEAAARLAVLSPEALIEIAPAALDFFKDSLPENMLQPFYQLLEAGDEPSLRRMLVQFSGVEHQYQVRDKEDDVFNLSTGQQVQTGVPPKGTLVKVPNPDGAGLPPVWGYAEEHAEAYVPSATAADYTDVKAIVRGMKAGTLPPQLPGRASPGYLMLMAETEREGFDLATAATDWIATTTHLRSINSTKQLALRQGIETLPPMLDIVEDLARQWAAGDYPVLNKVRLELAKGGADGPEAAVIANDLEAMIADITADLGNVYMGGNSPTDHALRLAAKSLNAEWSEEVLLSMVALARRNIQIRKNSIRNVGAAGVQSDFYGFNTRDVPPGVSTGTRLWNPHLESIVNVAYADVNAALEAGLTRVEGASAPVAVDWFEDE